MGLLGRVQDTIGTQDCCQQETHAHLGLQLTLVRADRQVCMSIDRIGQSAGSQRHARNSETVKKQEFVSDVRRRDMAISATPVCSRRTTFRPPLPAALSGKYSNCISPFEIRPLSMNTFAACPASSRPGRNLPIGKSTFTFACAESGHP